jgi:hypothetical protein
LLAVRKKRESRQSGGRIFCVEATAQQAACNFLCLVDIVLGDPAETMLVLKCLRAKLTELATELLDLVLKVDFLALKLRYFFLRFAMFSFVFFLGRVDIAAAAAVAAATAESPSSFVLHCPLNVSFSSLRPLRVAGCPVGPDSWET